VTRRLAPFGDDWERALVVAAHPDDIEWGISAAVSAWTSAGHTVNYLLATRGEAGIAGQEPEEVGPNREAEQRRAATAVGVASVAFLDCADGHVVEDLDLRRAIARHIRLTRPDVVVAMNFREQWATAPGAPWNFADHRAVGRATIDAVYDAANEWIFPELHLDEIAPWRVRHIAVADPARATHAVAVTPRDIGRARESLLAHRRYLHGLGIHDLDSYVEGIVIRATTLDNGERAVAFEVLAGPAASTASATPRDHATTPETRPDPQSNPGSAVLVTNEDARRPARTGLPAGRAGGHG
jgi:LmbE family N-acetylglucosaminyl deacetylase